MVANQKLKNIPGFSQGVRENAAIRMVKMVRPVCPNSQIEMQTTPEGKLIPKRSNSPDRQNCQKMGFGWWKVCEEKGHNPYFTDRVWYEKIEEVDEAGEVTKTRNVRHHGNPCPACNQDHTFPNVVQVAAHIRVNAGQGARFKRDRHGFKRLGELGYAEVCQYRNCQKPITVTSRVGQYCSRQHAALIGADSQNIMLVQLTGRFEAGLEAEAAQRRARGLIEASQFIDIKDIE